MKNDPKYAFYPGYPEVGPRILLGWYERNEGNHFLMAKTQASIDRMFRAVLKKEPYAEPTKAYVGQIVSPPESLRKKVAENRYDLDLRCFMGWILMEVVEYHKSTGTYPAGYSPCPGYKSEHAYDEIGEYELEYHSSCVNCGGNKALYTGDKDQLFASKASLYNMTMYKPRLAKPSDLTNPPNPDKPLYVMSADFGHHRPGLNLTLMKPDESYGCYWKSLDNYPVFFFQGEEVDRPASVVAIYQDQILAEKAWKQSQKDRARAEKQKEEERAAARRRALFE